MFNKNETTLSGHRLFSSRCRQTNSVLKLLFEFNFLRATQNEDAEINDFIRFIICVDFFLFKCREEGGCKR
jgi:hypothetical protein